MLHKRTGENQFNSLEVLGGGGVGGSVALYLCTTQDSKSTRTDENSCIFENSVKY